jgi:hypothetical protein
LTAGTHAITAVYGGDATFTASTSAVLTQVVNARAAMTTPAPGSTLTGSSATFTWSAGAGVTQYALYVGKTVGGGEIIQRNTGTGLSLAVPGIPTDGSTVFVRLWSLIGGVWQFNDYTYTAANFAKAVLLTPAPGSILAGSSVTFTWSAGTAVTQYAIYVGKTLGGVDIFQRNTGTGLTQAVTGIPTDGSTVFVRLWSLVGGGWQFNDYTYTAANFAKAVMLTPTPGSTLAGSSVTFTWSTGTAVSQYAIYVGKTVGGGEIIQRNTGTGLSLAVTGIPTDGSTVFVRLWSLVGGGWQFNDYTYTAANFNRAVLLTPTPGSTLTSSTVTFTWSAGTAVTQYAIYVGTTLGGGEIIQRNTGTGLSLAVPGIPTAGSTVFVRLWSLIGGGWQFNDYTYTAATCSGC